MDQLKQIQPKKQMTKTSVVSSDESKPCVVMTSQLTTNQEHVVSLHKPGTLLPVPVKNVPTPKHRVNSKPVSINRILVVLVMEIPHRHTSSIDSPKLLVHQQLMYLYQPPQHQLVLKSFTLQHHLLSEPTRSNVSTVQQPMSQLILSQLHILVPKIFK